MVNEAILNTTEGGLAAVTPVAGSEITNADILSDFKPNESHPGPVQVDNQEFLGPIPLKLRRHVNFLVSGAPFITFFTLFEMEQRKSLGITPYRIIMSIVLVLGIPSALLSFLRNSTMASGIIGVSAALCAAMLFWVKRYRDRDKGWAPWLFEKDVSEFPLIVWFLIQAFINLIPVPLTVLQIAYLLDDKMSSHVRLIVPLILCFFLQIGAGWLVVLTIISDRSRLWLRKMHFVPLMLLEEVMIVAQRLISILLCIGCARLRGFSFDDAMFPLHQGLRTMSENAGVIITTVAFGCVVGLGLGLALNLARKMRERRSRRRIGRYVQGGGIWEMRSREEPLRPVLQI